MKTFLRTSDIAKACDLSVQVVRNYERLGFLPLTDRTLTGYRCYTQQHLQALKVSQALIASFTWKHAHTIMQSIHQQDVSTALAVIDGRHTEIHQQRRELEETLRILHLTAINLPAHLEGLPRGREGLHISEAAQLVNVKPSAIRFWEAWGLLHPHRDTTSRYRIYDAEQMRKLRVIALLRKANYGFEEIHSVIKQVSNGNPEQAMAAAKIRLKELTEVSYKCIQATAALWTYIEKYSYNL